MSDLTYIQSDAGMEIGTAIACYLAILVFIVIIILLIIVFTSRRSRDYRKYLGDMYVSARIRQLADENKLDLIQEDTFYKAWRKRQRMVEDRDFDTKVLEDLNETIEADQDVKVRQRLKE